MNRSWEFFTRVVSTDATHCQSVWQWRCRCDFGVDVSPHFQSLRECVADARLHGFEGEQPPVSIALVPCAPCRPAADHPKPCGLHEHPPEALP